MTTSLAVRLKEEDRATVAQPSLADLGTYVDACTRMGGEELGEYVERNWDNAVGNALGLMFLVKEMKRKFKLLDRKKQVNGQYLTIRGYKSFDKWFTKVSGKSRRLAYYLLETEEKKNERNAGRRTSEKKKDRVKSLDHPIVIKLGQIIRFEGLAGTFQIAEGEGAIFLMKGKKYSDQIKIAVTEVKVETEKTAPKVKKVKKISAADTDMAIASLASAAEVADLRGYSSTLPYTTLNGLEEYAERFEAAVTTHPEWYPTRVAKARKRIRIDRFQYQQKAKRDSEAVPDFITHRVGETYDDGTQAGGRLTTYALCGQRFTKMGASWPAGEPRHENAHNETPTCEKCKKLAAKKQVT